MVTIWLVLSLCQLTTSFSIKPHTKDIKEAEPRNVTPIDCRCSPGRCHDDSTTTCKSSAGMCFYESKAVVEDGVEGYIVTQAGCIELGIESDAFICSENGSTFKCCYTELCNDIEYIERTNPPIEPTEDSVVDNNNDNKVTSEKIRPERDQQPEQQKTSYSLYIVGVIVFLITLILGGMLLLKFCWPEKEKILGSNIAIPLTLIHPVQTQLADITASCSSGSGIPRLMEKTLIREITFNERIGKGRYGEVWRGNWRAGGEVAIKVFSNREESSWWHEAEMYQNYWLRHDNILSFIGADQRDCVADMQYYLVLHFHPRGSLYDFLQSAQLTMQETIKMLLSLSSGLDYLHSEIRSSVAKPSIAHRDLKTKNILVKNNGQCCIADFGLSVRSDYFENIANKKQFNFQVGTKRYMAPEILDSSINLTSFEYLKKVDMYMFSLVVWEIGRCVSPGAEPYQYPFQHDVPCDPSIDEMATVVVKLNQRPSIDTPSWSSSSEMVELSRIVSECWNSNPLIRLTSLRVKKDLMKLVDNLARSRDSGCYITEQSDQGFISWG